MKKIKRPLVIYFPYQKTASKWLWYKFLREKYDTCHLDLINNDTEAIKKFIYNVEKKYKQGPIICQTALAKGTTGGDYPEISKKLVGLSSDIKILITIRSQSSLLQSHYGQYIINGGSLKFSKFKNKIIKNTWRYYSTISYISSIFGEDKVYIALFEDLEIDPYQYILNIKNFIEDHNISDDHDLQNISRLKKINEKRNDLVLDVMRILNKLKLRHKKNIYFPEIRLPGTYDQIFVVLTEYLTRIFDKYFNIKMYYRNYSHERFLIENCGDENRKLAKYLNRNLKELGYPL